MSFVSPFSWPKSLLLGVIAAGLVLTTPDEAVAQSPDGEMACAAAMGTQPEMSVTSSILRSDRGGWGGGAGVGGGQCRASQDDREVRPRRRVAAVSWDVTAPVGFSNPLPAVSQIEGTMGLQMALSRRGESGDYHFGFLGASLRAQLESTSDFRNQVLALGPEVQWTDPARPFLPSVAVFVGPAHVIRSGGVAATSDPPEEELRPYIADSSRLSLRGWWALPLPAGLALEADGAIHRGRSGVGTIGFSQIASPSSEELRVGLVWRRGSAAGTRIEAISLSHDRGRPPAAPYSGELWTLRVEVGW
ncbi:MAG: hypothetical protein EA351_01005 [Gemmatimonadales bacterium]|nr:MAG: hypothetical protein EA351_01005 [Gemmatimonadales bacterium]